MSGQSLLQELGARLSVNAEWSAENTCDMEFDGLGVHFELADSLLYVIAELGTPSDIQALAPELLKGNFPGGKAGTATLSLHEATGCVMLHTVFDENASYAFFENSLAQFVKAARYWKDWIETSRLAPDTKSESSESGQNDFLMRV